MKLKNSDTAISQIMGTTLLLLIALACLSMIYSYVLSYPLPESDIFTDIVGRIEESNIILLHSGGEDLALDTKLIINKGNSTEFVNIENYLESNTKNKDFWNIGEQLVYPIGDVTGVKVDVSIIDRDTEQIIFHGWLKNTFSDTYDFDSGIGKEYYMYRIPFTSNIVVVYTDSDNDGFVLTFELAEDGDITKILDSLEFDPVFCNDPKIIHVFGDIFAICYRGQGSDGTIITVEVSPNGSINNTIIDTGIFDAVQCLEPSIVHISGDVFAIAYRGDGEDGFLKTIPIQPNGDITAVIDILEFDTNQGIAPDILHITGDYYAIAYSGENEDGYLKTVEIAANGVITSPVIDTLEFDPSVGRDSSIIHVNGDFYAIAYEGESQDGFLKTVEIDSNGTINNVVVDSVEFDTDRGGDPDITHISGNIFAIAYRATGDIGKIITVEITNAGIISNPMIDAFNFSSFARNPQIIHVYKKMYSVAYKGSGNEGYLTTVFIANNGNFY
jgi:hypothetical protein